MNVLYLADTKSIHDRNWIESIPIKGKKYVVCRNDAHFQEIENVIFLGFVGDFSLPQIFRTIKTLFFFQSLIRKHEIDVLHIMFAEPNALWAIVKFFVTVKVILTTRGTDILKTIPDHFKVKNIANVYVKRLYKLAFKKIDGITSTSVSQIESVKKLFGHENVQLIRTGVDFERIDLLKKGDLPEQLKGKSYVFFPRNMRAIYNHEFCLESIRLLPIALKEKFTFVFLDKNSNHQEYVRSVEDKMNEMKDVKFQFFNKLSESEFYPLLRHASLVVMTPLSDGTPVSAMEAMVLNRPLILGALEYDSLLFGEVPQLTQWDENELSQLMKKELLCSVRMMFRDNVELNANRKMEMRKVERIYS